MTHHATSVSSSTPLEEIARLLVDGHISGVPVVDDHERVIGFVSETDLMATLVRGSLPGSTASDVMSHPPIVVDEFATTDEVMTILRTSQIHHLPVVRSGRLVGLITPLEVLKYFVEKLLPPPQEVG